MPAKRLWEVRLRSKSERGESRSFEYILKIAKYLSEDLVKHQDFLFAMRDVKTILPHLHRRISRWSRLGLFTPRWPLNPTSKEPARMSMYDLCALQVLFLLFECGMSGNEIHAAISDRVANFHCEGLSEEMQLFLATGGRKGEEISRFIEACDFDVQIRAITDFQGHKKLEFFHCPDNALQTEVSGAVMVICAKRLVEQIRPRIPPGCGRPLVSLINPTTRN
jgi:hypothetical protein